MTKRDVIVRSAKFYLENHILPEIERTKQEEGGMDEEAVKAQKLLDNWIEGNDPTIRNALKAYVEGMDEKKRRNFCYRGELEDEKGILLAVIEEGGDGASATDEEESATSDALDDVTHTKPRRVTILGEEKEVKNWIDVMAFAVKKVDRRAPGKVWGLAEQEEFCLRTTPEEGRTYKEVELDDGRIVYVSGTSAKYTIEYAKRLLRACDLNDNDIIVSYRNNRKTEDTEKAEDAE